MLEVKLSALILTVATIPQRQTKKKAKNVSSKLYNNDHHTNCLPTFFK
jgi:hypothetical protein